MSSLAPSTRTRALVFSLLSLISGALLFLSCADFDIWPLTWIAVAPLLAVVLDPRTKRPHVYGFLCGLVANAGGFYWMVGFLERFGHLPSIASLPIFALLIAYQAITFTLFAWIVRRISDHVDIDICLLAPLSWVAVEAIVPYVFPWYLSITQAWVPPVIQIAEITGPLGVSGLIILSNAAIYSIYAARRDARPLPRRSLVTSALVLVAALVYGQVRIHQVDASRAEAPKLSVGVVQANIGIGQKNRDDLPLHQALSRKLESAGAELIVWPESSYPYAFSKKATEDYPETDARRARRGFSAPLIMGSLTIDRDVSPYPYNTALFFDGDGKIRGSFDKNILMVFGEYVPYYEELKFLQKMIPDIANFSRGKEVTVFSLDRPGKASLRLAPMICYEDIFPSFGRRVAKLAPNLLVNITNDAWFGHTSEPWEHMALSVYRAVETRLDLVRAVGTGVSTVITATGRVEAKTTSTDPYAKPAPEPMTLLHSVALLSPVTIYATLGETFGIACILLVGFFGARALTRAGRPLDHRRIGLGIAILGAASLVAHLVHANDFVMAAVISLGSAAVGVILRRQKHAIAVETAIAVVAVVLVPPTLLGSEGEQASLVIGALVAVAIALAAGKLSGDRTGT